MDQSRPQEAAANSITDTVPSALEFADYDTLVGKVVSPHGIQGSIKIRPVTPTAHHLFMLESGSHEPKRLLIGDAYFQVLGAKRQDPKDLYILRLKGVDTRSGSEALVGKTVYARGAHRAPLVEDEYFTDDLIGLNVSDKLGKTLGKITAVHNYPANDVYETDTGVLIAAVKYFVASIDLEKRTLTVHDADALKIDGSLAGESSVDED